MILCQAGERIILTNREGAEILNKFLIIRDFRLIDGNFIDTHCYQACLARWGNVGSRHRFNCLVDIHNYDDTLAS